MAATTTDLAGTRAALATEMTRVRRTGELIDRALFVVAGGALVFTCANVTLFAIAHGTPWVIGWLLDPLASVALLAVLVGDGALSRHGIRAGAWAGAVKLGAGLATWAMNVWASVAGQDLAAVLLHSVAPGLLIGLGHAAPAYRIGFASILDRLSADLARTADAPPDPRPPDRPRAQPRSSTARKRGQHRSQHRPAPRSVEALRAELRAAIEANRIDQHPTAEAIRRLLACAPSRARLLRDELNPTRPTAEGSGR